MNKFLLFFQKRLLPNFLVILYAGVSIAIASAASYKFSQTLPQTKQRQEINNILQAKTESDIKSTDTEETNNSTNLLADVDINENSPKILGVAFDENENQSTLLQNPRTQSSLNSLRNNSRCWGLPLGIRLRSPEADYGGLPAYSREISQS